METRPHTAELIQIDAEEPCPTENGHMSGVVRTITEDNVEHAAKMLPAAADVRKCWACGCLRHSLDTIAALVPWPDATTSHANCRCTEAFGSTPSALTHG